MSIAYHVYKPTTNTIGREDLTPHPHMPGEYWNADFMVYKAEQISLDRDELARRYGLPVPLLPFVLFEDRERGVSLQAGKVMFEDVEVCMATDGDMAALHPQRKWTLYPTAAGTRLTLHQSGPTDEGSSSFTLEIEQGEDEDGTPVWCISQYGACTDCDGRHSSSWVGVSNGEPETGHHLADLRTKSRCVEVGSSQRDHAAEAAGY